MTYIKESYHSNMTLKEAEKLVLQTLKNVMEEKIKKDNIEIVVVKSDTKKMETRSQEYVEDIIQTLS
jgi:20S proteasome alpha/beta subunit